MVSLTMFSKDGLSVISTKLGTLLMLDSYTSERHMQSWGRSSYARAMIELRADVELKDTIMVAMPKLVGEGFYLCMIRVKYDWKPPSSKKKQHVVPRREVSNSNPFDVVNSIKNDDELDKIDKLERQILDGKLIFMDDDGNLLIPTGNVDNKSEVEVVFDETTNLMASTSSKGGSDKSYGTNSLLEQWRETKWDDD
ncbi:hypothetical protein Tco_0408639 [Tanacetum coccineum]